MYKHPEFTGLVDEPPFKVNSLLKAWHAGLESQAVEAAWSSMLLGGGRGFMLAPKMS